MKMVLWWLNNKSRLDIFSVTIYNIFSSNSSTLKVKVIFVPIVAFKLRIPVLAVLSNNLTVNFCPIGFAQITFRSGFSFWYTATASLNCGVPFVWPIENGLIMIFSENPVALGSSKLVFDGAPPPWSQQLRDEIINLRPGCMAGKVREKGRSGLSRQPTAGCDGSNPLKAETMVWQSARSSRRWRSSSAMTVATRPARQ